MMMAQKLLNKIKWDKNENPDDYEIGYLDWGNVIFVKYNEINFEKENKFSFFIRANKDEIKEIPFHNIRVIKKQNKVIWDRR